MNEELLLLAVLLADTGIPCNTINHSITKNQQTMFTLSQIREAHSKVRSGADFPAYIREIKALGVTYYETYVTDGHTSYYGAGDFTIPSPARYALLVIADGCDEAQFKAGLKEHQEGKTDYPTFIRMSAACGIEKWAVCMDKMTCTYYDKAGNTVLEEVIPG